MNVVICEDEFKKSLLKDKKELVNDKIITLSEFRKKYLFDYKEDTCFYVCKKYNVIYDVAKIYLDNLIYINEKAPIINYKIKFLKELYLDLKNNNYIIDNPNFKNYLKNKNITIYNSNRMNKFYLNIFKCLEKNNNITYINEKEITEYEKKDLYKCLNKEEEIAFVASLICKLVNKGVDINNIKLSNVNNNYYYTIKKIFKEFNIPIVLENNSSIYGSLIVKDFIDNYSSHISETVNKLMPRAEEEKEVVDDIINVINKYSWVNDYLDVKDFIIEDIKNIKFKTKDRSNSVKVIDILNDEVSEEDYVFLINYNEGVIPITYKDEDFLSDKLKEKLGISTSYELNALNTKILQNKIKEIKNITITYSENDLKDKLYISSSYQKDLFTLYKANIKYNYSNMYNKQKLVSLKDEYEMYGTSNIDLQILSNKYKDLEYLTYDNSFKGINKDVFKEKINNISLSYTSMDDYYKCSFRYYLDYVLKLNKYEDSFEAIIGNIFHKILSLCFNDDFNYDAEYQNLISEHEFNAKETFFIENLKEELKLVIETIKEQNTHSKLTNALYEQEFTVKLSDEVSFIGFVDKIMYEKVDGKTICEIIDYKTGNPNISLEYAPLGLNMQLPVYIYLIKHSNLENAVIGGFYLQKILSNEKNIDKRIDSLKLQGYSNDDIEVLEKLDDSYIDSKVIKSLKMTSKGFSSYSKLINNEQIEELNKLVEDKILTASSNILDADFSINPKEVDGKLLGCMYCKYKDICYMKNEDIVKLKTEKEDNNGMD